MPDCKLSNTRALYKTLANNTGKKALNAAKQLKETIGSTFGNLTSDLGKE
jgi:hypothetical protein